MQISKRFPKPNYQLVIGVIIGSVFSLFLNNVFFGSVVIWKTYQNGEIAEFPSEQSIISKEYNATSTSRKGVRVLCLVLTYPKNHLTKAIHVKRTWGKRCDKLLFISSVEDSVIGSVAIPGAGNDRDWLWGKTRAAFKYAWDNHKDEFDWIMKADDDTYVIVENLKKFLSNYSSTDAVFFGCEFRLEIPTWVSGGAGYVLSKEALRKFVEVALHDPIKCRTDAYKGPEDAEMAKCLILSGGVTLKDSRDAFGKHRFLVFTPKDHVFPRSLTQADKDYWYFRDLAYPQERGMNCCANDAITFHYISPEEMYVFEYFLYHLRAPYGVYEEEKYVQEYPIEYPDSATTIPIPILSKH